MYDEAVGTFSQRLAQSAGGKILAVDHGEQPPRLAQIGVKNARQLLLTGQHAKRRHHDNGFSGAFLHVQILYQNIANFFAHLVVLSTLR